MDLRVRDWVSQFRGTPPPTARAAVVAVDEKSVALEGRWPWSREKQAELISKTKSLGASVVALDIVYSSPQDPRSDAKLEQSIKSSGTIGGYFFRGQQSIQPSTESLDHFKKFNIKQVIKQAEADLEKIIEFPFMETNIPLVQRAVSGLGYLNYVPDTDGLLRRIPMLLKFDGKFYPSLSLKAISDYYGSPARVSIGIDGVDSLKIGDTEIPTDASGFLTLNFYKQPIETYSAADILSGALSADVLKDKIIFIGVTEVGMSDVRPTPVHASFPGVAVHATVVSNVLQGFHVVRNNNTILTEIILLTVTPLLLLWLLTYFRSFILSLLVFLVVVAVLSAAYYWMIINNGWLLSIVYPLFCLLITFIAYQLYFNVREQAQTKFLRNAFSSYVSPQLVDIITNDPDSLTLSGERRIITTLFSDIRGFTTLSESLQPEELVNILNYYLNEMTRLVMEHHGTVDKYIGDAVMALFNAPVDIEDHQKQAATTALMMIDELKRVNQKLEQDHNHSLKIGIGLHCGDAIVGNMGGDLRFEFTAIGDAVNLASRIESATKMYGAQILISADLHNAIQSEFWCRELDRLKVRGRTGWTRIYELMDYKKSEGDSLAEKVTAYETILKSYYESDFQTAISKLERFLKKYGNDGPAINLLKRCQQFSDSPPPEDWNGVFAMP